MGSRPAVIASTPRGVTRAPETPPSLTRTTRGLRAELGRAGLTVAVIACCALPLLAPLSPVVTRDVYLSLASFHGWLELAALVFLATRTAAPAPRA